ANSGSDTRLVIDPHSYRACLILGVQPLRAQALLDEAAGGLPQRILWLPAYDPGIEYTEMVEVQPWKVPMWRWPVFTGPTPMDVPRVVVEEVRRDRVRDARSFDETDPLEGHANLQRLKAAAALAVHAGRAEMTEEDWQLAQIIMAVSRATRTQCQQRLGEERRKINRGRALASAEREEIVSDTKLGRAKKHILRKLADGNGHTRSDLRKSMKVDIRDHLDPALDDLIESQDVTVDEAMRGNRSVHVYRWYTPPKPTLSSADNGCTESTRVPNPADLAAQAPRRRRQRTRGKNRHSAPRTWHGKTNTSVLVPINV
ncbi:MAG: hypothetical protein ACRDU4_09860, partial [Mycobacterium sp.]